VSDVRASGERPRLVTEARVFGSRELAAALAPRVAWLRAAASPLVALDAPGGLEPVLWVWACIEAGVPFLPLHPRWTEAERRAVLADAGAPPFLPPHPPAAASGAAADAAVDAETPLAVVYTSGSSGRPKGVVLSRRAFVASAAASRANLGRRDDDRWLLALPPAHVGGLSILTRAWCDGSAVVVLEPGPFDEARVLAACAAHAVTLVSLVPTMLHRILARGLGFPPSVRAVLLGGAAASPALLAAAAEARVPVLTTYGLTEACSQVTTQRPGTVNRGELGAGPALPGVVVRVRDERILVRGPTLASGYWRAGPLPLDADGFYDTGDEGRLDAEGNLHVLGRQSDLVIVGGENVRPAEIEALAAEVPGVALACAFGVPDAEWGERLALMVVPAPGAALEIAAVAAALAPRLARFKRPTLGAVVAALPTIGIGKIDRRRAAAEHAGALRPLAPAWSRSARGSG
jgi:O-succinylbenzoic acid--CoA ligase